MDNATTLTLGSPLRVSENSIDLYIRNVKSVDALTAEQEKKLAQRLFNNEDLDAARQLIVSHLRFVLYIAKGYKGYGLPLADLVQEGNVGLMKAVKRFNPEFDVRLVSFAVHWIRAEIHEYILRNWRIVKVATTKAQRKLFFNLRRSKKRLGWFSHKEVQAVAEDLGVSTKDVLEMEKRLNAADASFDGPLSGGKDDDEAAATAPAAYLEDARFNPADVVEARDWSEHRQDKLNVALKMLDPRSLDIVQQRWLGEEKSTLQDLADKYSVSAERIRQIEVNAMDKLRKRLNWTLKATA